MLQELVIYAALAAALSTLLVLVPGVAHSRIWVGLPLGAAAAEAAGWLAGQITGDPLVSTVPPFAALLLVATVRFGALRRWSWPAAQLFTLLVTGSVLYLVYAAVITVLQPLGVVGWLGSVVLWLLEVAALGLSLSYAFELLDVLGRRDRPYRKPDPGYRPPVALQVPAYNEPLEVVEKTLRSLAELRYDRLLVQVVDNNTPEEKVWRGLEKLCQELGPRFQFIHLENWPGFKAGALNEATRRLPKEYEVLGIVDADYVVEPGWLEELVGLFADPKVAFVQSSQDYRDWKDDAYLRGLFYSYRYFFDVSMPSRAQRNAIIFAGTMGLLRRSVLEEIGGWNPDCVTEDSEASLRMLGRGYSGIYDPGTPGAGLMPLSFDGLKKQRFRWSLGGIQILRLHWRELLPFGQHKLQLSFAQRTAYLLGCVQWFGEALTFAFTLILLLTAAFLAVRHRLPVRQLVGAVVVVPPLFLGVGLLRALWGVRASTRCSIPDAVRALGVWVALSWVVTLACLRGLVRPKAAFLRTPKQEDGASSLLQALNSCRVEVALALLCVIAAVVIPLSALTPATLVLAALLLYQAAFYASAPWASLAAEGITLTEFRKIYKQSAQNTGDRPQVGGGVPLVARAAAALGAVALLGILFGTAQSGPAPQTTELPPIGKVAGEHKKAPPQAPAPVATAAPTAEPSTSPTPKR
ncbi:MAG TPA: glycosyltransferase [Candidatus Dormibacteraeota bacterium]